MAECHGWELLDHQTSIGMLSFIRRTKRINVYYSKMTVAICKNGSQEFIKNVSENKFSEILFRETE